MPGEEQGNDAKPDDLDSRIEEKLQRSLNAAVSTHVKRAIAGLTKDLEGMITRAVSSQPTKADAAEDQEPKAEPKAERKPARDKALEDRLAMMESKLAERDKQLRDSEAKSRKASAHATLRSELEKRGITGARARAVIADMESSGILRMDDEDGVARLAVRRARAKGAPAEEMLFDLSDGVEDWMKTPDAAEFVAVSAKGAPQTFAQKAALATRVSKAGEMPRWDKPAKTPQEAAERTLAQLSAKGVDVNDITRLITED